MAAPKKPSTETAGVEFTREQLLELVKTAPEAVVELVLMLQDQVRMLRSEVGELKQEVRELKERLALNSRNSNKPTVSDTPGGVLTHRLGNPDRAKMSELLRYDISDFVLTRRL